MLQKITHWKEINYCSPHLSQWRLSIAFTISYEKLDLFVLYYLPLLQITSGAELAVLFVETLLKGKLPYSEETMGQVLFCWCNIAYSVLLLIKWMATLISLHLTASL